MVVLKNLLRLLYRIRWYLIILPLIVVIIVWFLTRKQDSLYNVETTIYTGIISGYSIESTAHANSMTNMANLLLIISTEKTLKRVSLRLLAKCYMKGDPENDTEIISAEHYRELLKQTPEAVLRLVNKSSEKSTVRELEAYSGDPTKGNFIHAIQAHHPYFGVRDIASRLKVVQMAGSDMIQIGYSSNDAGISYYTLEILNEEFINQYQQIRYGETNNVIKFFEQEVNRLYRILCGAEDDLIAYNVSKRIINYGEQTKMVANMDASHKTRDNEQLLAIMAQRATVEYLEAQIGSRIGKLKNNVDYIASLEEISRLKSRLSNLELMQEENNQDVFDALGKARLDLENEENRCRAIVLAIANDEQAERGVKKDNMIERWLDATLSLRKTEAEMQAMDVMRRRLEDEFLYFSPIGATLNRKERHIGFVESNYMEMLKALNAARLRQRNLQLSTATLRVLNPPMYPFNSAPSNRLMLLIMAWAISTLAIIAFFFLIELLDRTLRDRHRTERLTKVPVLGCYPKESNLRYRKYNKVISDMALQHLSRTLLPYLDNEHQNIINLISTTEGNGKSYLANELDDMWTSLGLQVRRMTYDEDFLTDDRRYIMAKRVEDLCPELQPDEVLIVEYPSLDRHEIPTPLLNQGTVNIIVSRANRTWKDTDQRSLDKLTDVLENKDNLFFYLTEAGREAIEEFVGQIPPYTPVKNFVYRISQLGLTAIEYTNQK